MTASSVSASRLEELLSSYVAGDEGALAAIVELCLERVYSFAFRNTASRFDAEDLSQDILLEICRSLSSLRRPEYFWRWLSSVEKHVAMRWQARRRGRPTISTEILLAEDGLLDPAGDTAAQSIELEEQRKMLRRLVAGLSHIHRQVLVSYYVGGKSLDEIADHCQIPVGTVKRRLHDARQQLSGKMREEKPMRDNLGVPKTLWVTINGHYKTVEPWKTLDRLLPQNIAFAAYEKQLAAEEIAEAIGVSRAYTWSRRQTFWCRARFCARVVDIIRPISSL